MVIGDRAMGFVKACAAILAATCALTVSQILCHAQSASDFGVKNPGFEEIDTATGKPTAWEYREGCQPVLVDDCHLGVRAHRVDRGWLVQRLGSIQDTDPGQPITIQLYLKGEGQAQVFFLYTDAAGTPTFKTWQERQAFFPLTSDYLPCVYTSKIPPGTKLVEIWMGITAGQRGTLFVDDVSVSIGLPPPAPPPPDFGPELPADLELTNLAPTARIVTYPYATLAWRMVDQDEPLGTGLLLEKSLDGSASTYDFQLGQTQAMAAIRFCMPLSSYSLRADTNGDGAFETLLLTVTSNTPASYWKTREWAEKRFWPPLSATGIRLVNFGKEGPIFDFQILSPKPTTPAKASVPQAPKNLRVTTSSPATPPQPALGPTVPSTVRPPPTAGQYGEDVTVPPPAASRDWLHGVHIEPWMFACQEWIKLKPRPALRTYPAFMGFVGDLKRLRCNLVWFFPPRTFGENRGAGVYPYDVIWPSQFERFSYPENLLKEMCDAFHQEGIKVFIMDRDPLPKPPAAGEPTNNTTPVISSRSRAFWAGVCAEQAAAGVDALSTSADEEYWGQVRYPGQADAVTRAAYQERYGLPFPERAEDTEAYRKWCLMAYEEIAARLRGAAQSAKAVNPNVLTTSDITVGEAAFNDRMNWGAAYDIIGHQGDMDYFGTDPYHTQEDPNMGHYNCAAFTKRLLGGNVKRKSIVTINCPWTGDSNANPAFFRHFPPVSMYGPAISSVMHGGTAVAYWRYNFTFYGGYDKYVIQAYALLRDLAAMGATEAQVPETITVLKSRASEDWWQIKMRYGAAGRPKDQYRGFIYEKWLLELLFMNGYPFRLLYLDQPDDFADLSRCKLAILPFPYSVSAKAAAHLRKAAEGGTKVLLLGQQGETDEYGTPHPKPLLTELVDAGKAVLLNDDMLVTGHYPETMTNGIQKINELLGENRPLRLKHDGSDVEIGLLERSPTEKFVSVINWANHPTTVELGLNLPMGRYQVLERDLERARQVLLDGERVVSQDRLQAFAVDLEAGAVKVFWIAPVEGTNAPNWRFRNSP